MVQRWQSLALGFGLGLLGAVGQPAIAHDQTMESVVIETIPVDAEAGIYLLQGEGGNIGLSSGSDGAFLIDDQFAPLTNRIRAAIAAVGTADLRFVLNTHWHFDHTGGNENLGAAGVAIVAHDNVRQRMSAGQAIATLGMEFPPAPDAALPILTFADHVTFHLNDQTIHVMHLPNAHTDGDAIVHFAEANVIHMGDTYFHTIYPFIDIESGGSLQGVLAAVDYVLTELADDGTKIIPGHGPLSNKAELEEYQAFLETTMERMTARIAAGESLEEIIAADPLPEYSALAEGFLSTEQFLTIVYNDLMRAAE